MKYIVKKMTPIQLIVSFYSLSILLLGVLLHMPFSLREGVSIAWIDAFFTATSAVSVTGLSSVSIVETFSPIGIGILILGLQLGGIGVMALGTFVWMFTKKKIGLRERKLIMVDQNQSSLAGLYRMMKQILFLFIGMEIVGTILLSIRFYHYFKDISDSLYHGLFAAVSASTNAGFDLTGYSLIPYKGDYFIQIVIMSLIVLGAIGFPVLLECKQYLRSENKKRFRFSLFAKLTSVTFLLLVVVGMVLIFLFEYQRMFYRESWHMTFFSTLFQSITTRSAGLTTIDITHLSTATLFLMSLFMFIGASPSSVGGGIRTTTFAVSLLFLYNFAKGRKEIKIFNRELHDEDVMKAFVVLFLSCILCSFGVIIISLNDSFSLMEILFEVTSAFGTTGLSLGITGDLTASSKIVLMILMFAGRIGLLSFLFLLGRKEESKQKIKYNYPKEHIPIG